MKARVSGVFVVACLFTGRIGPAAAVTDDVLLRSPELWDAMERIHRQGVTDRIGEISDAGTFTADVNLGYRAEVRVRLYASLIFRHRSILIKVLSRSYVGFCLPPWPLY